MAGLLDLFGPDVVNAMQAMAPTEADKQRAMNMGLLNAGLGMLANNRGYGSSAALQNAVGRGGLQGLDAYQQNIRDSQQEQMRQLGLAQMMEGFAQKKRVQEAMRSAPQDVQQAVAMGVPYADIWKRQNPEKKFETIYDANGREIKAWINPDGTMTPVGNAKSGVQAINLGGSTVFADPAAMSGRQLGHTMGPGEAANLGIARQRLALDQAQAAKPQFHDGAWVTPPTMANPEGGMIRTPMYAPPKGSPENIAQSANKAIGIIDEADKLLNNATGSYVGTGIDIAGQAFGASTRGAQATAKLKALEGSLMMAQPRMEGPQSDKDAALYKQMAGQIGDPTIPVETRRAALQTIRDMHAKYSTTQPVATRQSNQRSVSVGQVMDGYRFKGGNPADPNAWEKQ